MFLHLIYSLEYTKPVGYCEKIVEFKETLDWEAIKNHESTLRNDLVYQHYRQVRQMHCPEISHPSVSIYFTELNYKGVDMKILYFEFKNLELITPEYINGIPTIPGVIHRQIKTMNYIYTEDLPQFEYKINTMLMNELTKQRFYKTDPLHMAEFVKTKIYSHQYDNIHWMLMKESNPVDTIIQSKIYKFDDGRIYRYEQSDFHTEETLPRLGIKGGVIIDEVGSGKSLQFICLAMSNPHMKNIILVPDHLRNQWECEFKKHLNIPMPPNIMILSFTQYKTSIEECDRLLVDELHELYSIPSNHDVFRKAINDKAKFKWGLTATPFPNINNSISNILRFLTSTYFSEEQLQKYMYNFPTIMKIFKKNTHDMIRFEVNLPELEIHNEFIDFRLNERAVYDAEREAGQNADINTLRKICCDVLLSITNQEVSVSYKSLKALVKDNYQLKYSIELAKLEEYAKMIDNAKKTFEEIKNQNLLANIKHLENEYIKQNEIVESKKKSLDFINEHFAGVPTCPYCMGDIDKENNCSIIKKCNHYFCVECLENNMAFNQSRGLGHTCPNCRGAFNKSDVISVVSDGARPPKYPSKIMRLLQIIDNVEGKIIIYTQFDALIQKLKVILDTENISSIIFNSHTDIEIMRNTDCKVLILSSGKNASGLDLTFINKIVIFEPFIGSHAHLRDIEKQIIGRIYRNGQSRKCDVFRLIIKDTIEEQIYTESM